MQGLELVDYRPELLEDAAQLRSRIWGAPPALNAAYLEWKYERNPYLPEPVVQFALAQGRVVGMRASVGTCWEIPGRIHRQVLPHGADAMVDPAYQRRGVFRALLARAIEEFGERGFSHSITLSANASSEAVANREGWSLVGALEMLERRPTRRPARGLTRRVSRSRIVRRAAESPFSTTAAAGVFVALDAAVEDGVAVSGAPRPAAMAELCRGRSAAERLRHVRDAAYFEWRFGNPLCSYRFLFSGGERLDGYVVAHWGGASPVLNIVDWEVSSLPALSRLLEVLGRHSPGRIRVWGSTVDGATVACLADAGYLAAPRAGRRCESLLVRPVPRAGATGWTIDGLSLRSLDGWSLRMADSDLY